MEESLKQELEDPEGFSSYKEVQSSAFASAVKAVHNEISVLVLPSARNLMASSQIMIQLLPVF
ncbi:hypothetical protein [Myxosarcina sp. GI1]|uniref:hypothetical protein n=1 Tax=Myxosarcina sp. GI1 TaxID=1541065 RepID=UPI000562EEC1|nr:hypothetical protein [Myxosarcina sp. GI1]